tara:strand:+ start:9310 stop:9807 length:498 start_codon:yes stop_codon:yes gene_type:complete
MSAVTIVRKAKKKSDVSTTQLVEITDIEATLAFTGEMIRENISDTAPMNRSLRFTPNERFKPNKQYKLRVFLRETTMDNKQVCTIDIALPVSIPAADCFITHGVEVKGIDHNARIIPATNVAVEHEETYIRLIVPHKLYDDDNDRIEIKLVGTIWTPIVAPTYTF